MSNQSSSYTSYSSTSYSSSSSSNGGQPQVKSYTEHATYDSNKGGSLTRESRETGQPTLRETREFPVQGALASGGNAATNRQIEDVTDKDQEYLDRMEDEYAKREGGA